MITAARSTAKQTACLLKTQLHQSPWNQWEACTITPKNMLEKRRGKEGTRWFDDRMRVWSRGKRKSRKYHMHVEIICQPMLSFHFINVVNPTQLSSAWTEIFEPAH